jgi:predicted nucleic acid-binding protein
MILLDTNIILRSKQSSSLHYKEVTEKLIGFVKSKETLIVCPQIIYEFYVVATHPEKNNGFGLSAENANNEIENILETYTFLDNGVGMFQLWMKLIKQYNIIGKKAHDTRLVAFMQSNNIEKLYTLNKPDFVKFNNTIELV